MAREAEKGVRSELWRRRGKSKGKCFKEREQPYQKLPSQVKTKQSGHVEVTLT